MNKFPLWKNLLILFIVLLGCLYASPNLFAPDPAIQITGQEASTLIDQATLDRSMEGLRAAHIEGKASEVARQGKAGLMRLASRDDQLPAKQVLERALGAEYPVRAQLSPTPPASVA